MESPSKSVRFSFFIWRAAPDVPSVGYVVDAPGLALAPQADGSIAMVAADGATVGSIPHPYAVDSTPDALAGGGRYTDAVTLTLGADGRTVTATVDAAWLKTAVYPVYVDPTMAWTYNAGSSAYGDAHTASNYTNSNFANYARPDSPYYYEMWNGTDPSGTSGTSYDFLRWDLSAYTNVTVDSASLALYPYHQYYNAPATETTYVRRVAGPWTENGIKWSNQPVYGTPTATAACVEGSWCTWDVAAIAQGWLKGAYAGFSPDANNGFQVDTIGKNSTYWKRFISSENGGTTRPKLTMTYHVPTVTAAPKTAFSADRSFAWTYADSGSLAQTRFEVQLSTDGGTTWPAALDSGDTAGTAPTWTAPATMVLTDLAAYTWHVRVYNGTSWSAYSAVSAFTFDAWQRGQEDYLSEVPYDLGGGWNLGIGVHNGAATLSRSFFSIPSYGPPQAFELAYSSAGPADSVLGYGWSSNLTQYLSFENGLVIWHRADGGRVAFPAAGGTAYGGHFETLATGATFVITAKDQSTLTFGPQAQGGHLLSIANRFGKALTVAGWGTSSVTATDPSGRQTLLTIGTTQVTVRDSAMRTWTLTLDGTTHDLLSITEPDPDGAGPLPAAVSTFTYTGNALNKVARARRAADGTTATITWTLGYNTAGQVSSIGDPALGLRELDGINYTSGTTYSKNLGMATVNGHPVQVYAVTTYTLDARGRPTTIARPEGVTTTLAYADPLAWNATSSSTPSGGGTAISTWVYDAHGNVTTQVDPIDAGTSRITKTTYDSVTNDVQSVWEATGVANSATTPDQLVTTYGYTGGHLTSVDVNCTSTLDAMPVYASGCTGFGTHDASTNLVTTYGYNAHEQLETETDPAGRVTRHVYDAGSATGPGNETATIRNYLAGEASTADRNVTTTFTFDEGATPDAGLVTTQTDPDGGITSSAYNQLGELESETAVGDTSIPTLVTTTSHDQLGNVLTETDPIDASTVVS
ncbi:MAG: DNRLRE domain-containing protein, partial [Chloroflexota bacterium]